MAQHLTFQDIDQFQERFSSSKKNQLACNAATRTPIKEITMNWERFRSINHQFSDKVAPELPITSQKHTGRCWLFAFTNFLRIPFAKHKKLEKFEFSQSYLFFWDKIEKAHFFLENIINTLNEPQDSRLLYHLLLAPVQDGGQWHMAVNLVNKYGLVPKSVYPETASCENSTIINDLLTHKLRECACILRKKSTEGASIEQLRNLKMTMMQTVYQMVVTHFGPPPSTFDFTYQDKDKKFHAHRNLTPLSFYKEHVNVDLEEYVCLVNSPRKSTPYNETYTVAYLGNVVEGEPIVYLNLPIEHLKSSSIKMLQKNIPVWHGCDVGKSFHRDLGVMDSELYDYELFYDMQFVMTKEERMLYGESQMTHAMLFTGVDLVNKEPNKWRVENSWGKKMGEKGFYIMTDKWFNEYLFEVAVHKSTLSKEHLALLEKPPTKLPLWDPLGALA